MAIIAFGGPDSPSVCVTTPYRDALYFASACASRLDSGKTPRARTFQVSDSIGTVPMVTATYELSRKDHAIYRIELDAD